MSVLERCPSYRESNKGTKERQGPTLSVSLIEVSVKSESTVHRSESVFDKSCDEEMPEMWFDEYIPFGRNKQTKLAAKRRAES